jgi:chemotaxis protein histidine kinase CheA
MTRTMFTVRRRTLLCATLLVLVVAITLAFVTAQEEQPAEAEAHAHYGNDESGAAPVVAAEDAAVIKEIRVAAAAEEEEHAPVTETLSETPVAAEEQQPAMVDEGAAAEDMASAEAEARRQQEAEEAERQRREEEERLRREEEERIRQAEEEERRRREEEERQRREEEERKRREEEERQRQAAEAERRRREEEERKRREAEEAARREAEEKAKRQLDSIDVIRASAKELKVGCAAAVEEYLFRVHENRQRPAAAVSETRAKLNEARVSAPEKVAALEKRLAHAQDTLLVFDVQTLRAYGGNVPKTCIGEGQAWYDRQEAVSSPNTYVQAYTHFYRIIAAHVYTMYRTAEGLVYYLMHAYTPSLAAFTATASDYQNKAWVIYEELFPAKGSRPELPIADFAKQLVTMVGYAAVPIGLGIAAGIVAVIALPPVAAGVLLYEFLYKIWAELFVFYYVYGMKMPEGLVTALKTTVANVKASQWDVLGTRTADAFFALVVDSDRIFYNGILALFLLGHVVVITAILMCVWCRCCVPGMRSRKAKKSSLSNNKGKSAKPAAGAAAAAPAKKKPSPPPASGEKKKN